MEPFEKASLYHRAVCSVDEAKTYGDAEFRRMDRGYTVLFFEPEEGGIKKFWNGAKHYHREL
jgi:hypothetical protein